MKTHFLPHPSRLTQLKLWGLLLLWAGHPLPEAQLTVTEVMYHPQEQAGEEDTEKLEFIELFNAGQEALSLEGLSFVEGVMFDFPTGAQLQAGAYLIVAKNAQAIRDHYGIENVMGNYEGSLDNNGETLRLVNALGEGVTRFRYGTRGRWPASADGAGDSLVLRQPLLNNDAPESWTHSFLRGGSPGWQEPGSEADAAEKMLIQLGSPGYYFKGTQEPSQGSIAWASPSFEMDASWLEGPSGYGYSNNAAEAAHLSTRLDDMRNTYLSVYARIPFQIQPQELESLDALILTMQYDDGFVAYLNGIRVGGQGVSGTPPAFDQVANAGSDYDPITLSLTSHADSLVAGTNWLCLQGHNVGIGVSSDFILGPQLTLRLQPRADSGVQQRSLVINEVFSNGSDRGDYLEIYNPTDQPVDITGMWLSDKRDALNLYQIPTDTIVPPRGFHVVPCSLETTGFALSSLGESVFLTGVDQGFIADSMRYGPMELDHSIARFPDGALQWFYQPIPTPGFINERHRYGPVLLHEIMYHPIGEDGAEFIELHNLAAEPMTLEDWSLIGVQHRFGADDSIPAQGYGVISDNKDSFQAEYPNALAAWLGDYRGRLSNGGEPAGLLDAHGIIVDWIDLKDTAPWPISADGLGASVERACWSDALNQPSQWIGSPLGLPSPGQANHLSDCPPPVSGGIVIAEVLYHPTIEEMDPNLLEFIKLQNITDHTIDCSGWILAGGLFHVLPEGTVLAAGSHVTLATSPAHLQSVRHFNGTLSTQPLADALPNGGGELALLDQDGQWVDQMRWDDDSPWPSLADGFSGDPIMGHSLIRLCASASGTLPSNWIALKSPTPHLPNASWECSLIGRPSDVEVSPNRIRADQRPIITVQWSLESEIDQIESVAVEYFVDDHEREGEALVNQAMQPTILNSGMEERQTWTLEMPPLPANSIVRYRIRTLSRSGQTFLSPAADQDAMEWHGYFVDPAINTNKPHQHHLFIASSLWRRLHSNTSAGRVSGGQPNPAWNDEVPATFVSKGKVIDVSVRHQGSRWNRKGGSNISFGCPSHQNNQAQVRSWRIRFPSYRQHEGIDTLLLQKQSGWPQRISFKMFELAGVAAPQTSWADLHINGCDFNGDAFQIERPGREMVDRFFGPVGDLFKSQGYTGDEGPWSWGDARLIRGSRNGFNQSDRYEYTYNRKTLNWKGEPGDGKPDIVEPMIQALHEARNAGKEALRAWLLENFDVDRTLRYICTINYVGTFDDMFQNYYLYRKAEDQKWCMFPWDMDNTLGGAFGQWNANPFRGANESRMGHVGNRSSWWHRIKDSFFIAFEQEFLATFHQLNNTIHAPAALRPIIESIATEGGYQNNANGLMNHIQQRHDYLNQFIEPRLGPPALSLEKDSSTIRVGWTEGRSDYFLEFSESIQGPWIRMVPDSQWIQESPTSFRFRPGLNQAFFRLNSI